MTLVPCLCRNQSACLSTQAEKWFAHRQSKHFILKCICIKQSLLYPSHDRVEDRQQPAPQTQKRRTVICSTCFQAHCVSTNMGTCLVLCGGLVNKLQTNIYQEKVLLCQFADWIAKGDWHFKRRKNRPTVCLAAEGFGPVLCSTTAQKKQAFECLAPELQLQCNLTLT